MTLSLEALKDSFGQATNLMRLLPEPDQTVLRRCATTRTFDQKLYERILTAGMADASMPFERLRQHSFVQQVPGPTPHYEIHSSYRQDLFDTWWPEASAGNQESGRVTQALRDFSARLVAYYAEQGSQIDQLYHLVAADRVSALKLFDELFAEAELAFELPYCQQLLNALEERQTILGSSLAERLRQSRLRLETRSMWAQEYYETVVYLEREQTRPLMDELVRGETADGQRHWILHLFATGGMGKSMFIRAAIARYCVANDIPTARIDFDFVPHIAHVTREPWRLLLRVAQQFNRQMADRPFEEVLAKYEAYIAEAGKRPIARPRDLLTTSAEEQMQFGEEAVQRIIDTLAEVWGSRSLVVVFDTLENLRHRRLELDAAFSLLKRVHDHCPGLRLILAGRFRLSEPVAGPAQVPEAERVPGFVEMFGGQERTVQLQPFTPEESRTYLASRRGLTRDARLDAIIEKAAGNPFKLALLADIATADPQLSEQEIADYPDADLAYLIERVVERIEDHFVRRLLRYGVVARQLTQAFVQEVMAPYLTGDSSLDNPEADQLPAAVLARRPFRTEANTHLDIPALWATLYRYSSNYSWVSAVGGERSEALVFHPDVVEPMRRLLRAQPIYTQLHDEARRYYERQAENEPGERDRWLAEAVYHKYSTRAADADDYWTALLTASRGDDNVVIALAEEVLALPGEDASLEGEMGSDSPRAGRRVRARANYELARRRLEESSEPSETLLFEVESWLREAERLNPSDDPVIPPGQLAYVRARLQFERDEYAAALTATDRALQSPGDEVNELALLLLRAQILQQQAGGEGRAFEETVKQAQKSVQAFDTSSSDRRRAAAEAARLRLEAVSASFLRQHGHYADAVQIWQRLLKEAVETNEPTMIVEYAQGLAGAATAGHMEFEAVEALATALDALASNGISGAYDPQTEYWQALVAFELALMLQRPDQAREAFDRVRSLAGSITGIAAGSGQSAALLQMQVRLAMSAYDLAQAAHEFERLAWDVYGAASAVGMEHLLEAAKIYIDDLGYLNQARQTLEAAEEYLQSDVLRVRHGLLYAHYLQRAARFPEARLRLAALSEPESHYWRIQMAIAALVTSGLSTEHVQLLADRLENLESHTARLGALQNLRRFVTDTATRLDPEVVRRLLTLLPTADTLGENIPLSLTLADVYRILGMQAEARRLLDRALDQATRLMQPVLLLETLRAYDRLGWEPNRLRPVSKVTLAASANGDREGMLAGLLLLEQAERVQRELADSGTALELLRTADARWSSQVSPWKARVELLHGRVSLTVGNNMEATGHLETAISLFESQGDPLSAEQARSLNPAAVPAGAFESLESLGTEQIARLELAVDWESPTTWRTFVTSRRLSASGDRSLETGFHLVFPVNIPEPLQPLLDLSRGESVSHAFIKEFVWQWRAISRELGQRVVPEQARQELATTGQHDLAWSLAPRRLAWLPWEFLRLSENASGPPHLLDPSCRYFYRKTNVPHRARSGQSSGVDVLIIRAGEAQETQMQRGYTQLTGYDMVRFYASHGARVKEISHPEPQMLAGYLDDMRPKVIHITAGILDRGRRLFLDLGEQRQAYSKSGANVEPARIGARELALSIGQSNLSPLVILNTPGPPSITEQLRQLCLRNAFAAELALSEVPVTILGTGLGDAYSQQTLTGTLVPALAEGIPVAEVARRIWMIASDNVAPDYWSEAFSGAIERVLPFIGTALYAGDPYARFPLGSS